MDSKVNLFNVWNTKEYTLSAYVLIDSNGALKNCKDFKIDWSKELKIALDFVDLNGNTCSGPVNVRVIFQDQNLKKNCKVAQWEKISKDWKSSTRKTCVNLATDTLKRNQYKQEVEYELLPEYDWACYLWIHHFSTYS